MILDTKVQKDIILAIIDRVNVQGSFIDQMYKLKQDVMNARVLELESPDRTREDAPAAIQHDDVLA